MSMHYHVKQMHQIVTSRGDYLYPIAHLCIINSTEDAGCHMIYYFWSMKYF